MAKPGVDEIEAVDAEIKQLATALLETPSPEYAHTLIDACRHARREMAATRFGRIVATFGEIADAAQRFKRPRADWSESRDAVRRAVAEMDDARRRRSRGATAATAYLKWKGRAAQAE